MVSNNKTMAIGGRKSLGDRQVAHHKT